MYQERKYRNLLHSANLVSFRVAVKETDLFIHAVHHLETITKDFVLQHRGYIEAYIEKYPDFARTLKPWPIDGPAPAILKDMAVAGQKAAVGPMAAVAGAIAEHVGRDLLKHTDEVIVENGGDVFIKTYTEVIIGIFAGTSPLSMRMGLRIRPPKKPIAVCTSSGTVGLSLSFGKADAVCVVSDSCTLADAAATSVGNRIQSKDDIGKAIDFGKGINGVHGLVAIIGDRIGLWGDLEIVPLDGKKG